MKSRMKVPKTLILLQLIWKKINIKRTDVILESDENKCKANILCKKKILRTTVSGTRRTYIVIVKARRKIQIMIKFITYI